jgi:hypothetical protein
MPSITTAWAPRGAQDPVRSAPRILQALAEQLAQPGHPVAHGLRVDAERGRHGLDLARAVEPGAQRGLHPLALAACEGVERRQARGRQFGAERRVGAE